MHASACNACSQQAQGACLLAEALHSRALEPFEGRGEPCHALRSELLR